MFGCAVISFRNNDNLKTFTKLTYNTYAKIYELTVMDNQGSPVRIYYGKATDTGFDLRHSPARGEKPTHRYVVRFPASDGTVREEVYKSNGQGDWIKTAEMVLK